MSKTALILGANGKIGAAASTAFKAAGWSVINYTRGTDMNAAAMGADVIVNGLNPPNYQNWAKNIPAITAQIITAAKASGARVIIPGNVYNFGDQGGRWDENTPQNPCSIKGKIRVEMEQAYRDAGVKTIILRAGNFIDPTRQDDVMGLVFLRDIKRGKITLAGRADAMQAYCYLPDWARAAVMLTELDGLTTFEDIPFEGHAFSANDLRDGLSDALGREIKFTNFPWWFMTALSPVWTLARELREMRYLWNTDHWLDGEKLRHLLPDFQATALRDVMLAGLPRDIHPDHAMRATGGAILAK